MDPSLVPVSKFLSLVLRHRPQTIGLTLDEHGWADVGELLRKASAAGRTISRETLEEVVATNDKRRFAFSEDGGRIRASQGHSLEVDLQLEPVEPPETLYHGTARRNLESIRRRGLERRGRTHVHLSADRETALRVGRRHGQAIVLLVDSKAMSAAGHAFFRSQNGVWLASSVPPEFLNAEREGTTEDPEAAEEEET